MSYERFLCSARRRMLWSVWLLLLSGTVQGAEWLVGIGDDCSNAKVCFTPSPLVIEVGDTVKFFIYNSSDFHGPHNVVADNGSFRCAQGCDGEGGDGSPRASPQWSFSRTFDVPGVFTYHDEVSKAYGVLFVQDPAAPVKLRTAYEYSYFVRPVSYFVTTSAEEMATFPYWGPWSKTFETFVVWEGPTEGTVPMCRFLDSIFGGHVFTPYAVECAALQSDPRWIYEGNPFYVKLPDENGDCPAGTMRLFRLYNLSKVPPPFGAAVYKAGAPVHRITTNVATFSQMRVAGWDFEGDGRTFAFACVAY